jgi:hypothetical protein
MLKILEPNRKRASQGCCTAPLKNGSRIFNIPANGSHRADHHWRHRLARYFTRAVFPFVMAGTKKRVFGFPPKKLKMFAGRWCALEHSVTPKYQKGEMAIQAHEKIGMGEVIIQHSVLLRD